MDSNRAIVFLVVLVLVHLFVNIRLTVDIIGWVTDARKRKTYTVLVWLLPLAGALYVYRRVAPDWFTPETRDSDDSSAVSAGLMGIDAIFNPGSRHIADAKSKGEVTIRAEGEMYDRDLPDFIDVEDAGNGDPRP